MAIVHILQKMDVLRSFEIAKFIPDDDLKRIREEVKSLPKKERHVAFEKKIDEIADSSRLMDNMPGLITPKTQALRTESLLKYSIKLATDIQKMGMSKEEQSFIIVSLVKLLELKLKNFNNWKESNGTKEDSTTGDDDEDQMDDDRDED